MYKKGFTLAEILIALTLIGVIAAVTLPGILGDTQHRDIRAKVQKAYNTLNNAYSLAYIDHDNAARWASSQSAVHNMLADQMKTQNYTQNDTFILSSDGISYQYTSVSANCSGSVANTGTVPPEDDAQTITSYCGTMIVNIKGETAAGSFADRPGINTFAFYLTDTGFVPYGAKGTNLTAPSLYVTGQVLYDGNFNYLN